MAKTYNLVNYEIYEKFKLLSISIQTPPIKTIYFSGESFDPTGMEVLAQFSDNISGLVTGYTYSPIILDLNTTQITISYANGGIIATATVDITVENPLVEIPYTNSSFTYSGSTKTPIWINYDSNLMTITGETSAINAGTYTVTFTLKENYKWSDGTTAPISKTWSISKASGSLWLSDSSITFYNNGDGANITAYGTGGSLTVSTSDDTIVTATLNGSQIRLQAGSGSGNATITVRRSSTVNYTSPSPAYVSVNKPSEWTKTAEYVTGGTFNHVAKGTSAVAIIAGGGGSGGSADPGGDAITIGATYGTAGGGGGAGGRVVLTPEISIIPGNTYKIVVGHGGAVSTNTGNSGFTSSAFGYTASGGDGGIRGQASTYSGNGANGKTGTIREEKTFSGRTVRTYDGSSGGAGGAGGLAGPGSPILSPTTAGTGGGEVASGLNGMGGNGGKGGYTSSDGRTFYPGKTGSDGTSTTMNGCGGGGGGGAGGGIYDLNSEYQGSTGGSRSKGASGFAGIVVIFEKGVT